VNDPSEQLQKVKFTLTPDKAPEGITHEGLWAFDLGDGRYRLDNSPFYCYGYSWHDIIAATQETSDDLPTVQRVITKSGHRTIRIAYEPNERKLVETTLARLQQLGCTFEGAFSRLYSVDIPPGVELSGVRDILIASEVTWEHADPTYEELFPNEPDA
jgi:hypothetical protein